MPAFLCLAILVLLYGTSSAQNFKQDFRQVQEAYSKLDKFYCEIKINMYETTGASKPAQVMLSTIKKQAGDFWYSMNTSKMIVNDRCILYINEESKKMYYSVRDKENEIKLPEQNPVAMVDSLLGKSDSIVYKGIKNGCLNYTVHSPQSIIIKSEMAIDKESHLMRSITYYYDEKKKNAAAKVTIEYMKINTAPAFTESDFSEEQYVVFSNNMLKPVNAYSAYDASIIEQPDLK